MTILDNHIPNENPMVATIGFFDGVHLGHRFLISQVQEEAARRGMSSMVITFGDHPLKVIREDFKPLLLNTPDEKLEQLAATGVDSIAVLDFDKKQSQMSAHDFMEKILLDIYNVRVLLIGYDHHFGHNREEGFDDYVRYGKEIGIEVLPASPLQLDHADGMFPSSTIARKALQEGDVEKANMVLGYSYFIEGTVVGGFQNGRKLGFPTANISVNDEKLVPATGVYFVKVGDADFGMLNIGTRPTLGNGSQRSIEVNIFDFHENIYSQSLKIEFLKFIRHEKKFDNIEQLQEQLENDEQVCRSLIRTL